MIVPSSGLRRPMIVSISSLWPLASMPARPTISPARTSSETSRTAGSPRSSRADTPSSESSGSPGLMSSFSTRRSTSRPTISVASERSVAPSHGTVSTFSPRRRTVIRSATSSTSLSLCEMKTIAGALGLEVAQDDEQVLRLLGGEHRGRLVEHEHLRAAEQRAQDLHPLLGAHAEVLHAGVRVDGQAEALRELARAPGRLLVVQQRAVLRLGAEHQVLGDRHHRHEHEVLVHHADAEADRPAGRADLDLARRRAGSRPRRAGGARRGRSSGSTCPRRSPRAARGSHHGAARSPPSGSRPAVRTAW